MNERVVTYIKIMNIFEEGSALQACVLGIQSVDLLLDYALMGLSVGRSEVILLILKLLAVVLLNLILLMQSAHFVAIFIRFKIRSPQKMASNVLVQIAFLSESQVAVELLAIRALEWPLFRVNPQVIVEVVPLPKVHGTAWIVALQDLQEPLGLRVLELENSEGPRRRNVVLRLLLVYFDFGHV